MPDEKPDGKPCCMPNVARPGAPNPLDRLMIALYMDTSVRKGDDDPTESDASVSDGDDSITEPGDAAVQPVQEGDDADGDGEEEG